MSEPECTLSAPSSESRLLHQRTYKIRYKAPIVSDSASRTTKSLQCILSLANNFADES